jgi:hypothetical protein
MARREVQPRQFTIYFNSREDLERFKKIAEPYTLNHWIMLTIEKAVEKPIRTKSSDEINALRKENHELRQENEVLTARLEKTKAKEVDALLEKAKGPMQLDKEVVDLLRSGGVWSSTRIIKTVTELYLRLDENKFKGGISEDRTRAIRRTLEELNNLDLVKKTWKGWAWNK